MKGKKIFRKIIVSVLILTMVLSNVTVAADGRQDIQEQTGEIPTDGGSGDGQEAVTVQPAPNASVGQASVESGSPADSNSSADTLPGSDFNSSVDSLTPQQPSTEVPPADSLLSDTEQDSDDMVESGEASSSDQIVEEETTDDETVQLPGNSVEPVEDVAEPKEEVLKEELVASPADFVDFMSIAQLTAQPMDRALATMALLEEGDSDTWSFDAYYVNEADRYTTAKTDDFLIKYQMEFHASSSFAEKEVQIRIESALFNYRGGRKVAPSDLGIPHSDFSYDEDGNLIRDEDGNPVIQAVSNKSTPFNYYYVDEAGKPVWESYDATSIVFYNYKPIASGTNVAWQVLYKDLHIMDIIDGTSWELHPQVSIDAGVTFKEDYTALTGSVDSSVTLTSVVKEPYYESGSKYTPGLYTLDQVRKYSDYVDPTYITADGRLDTQNYRYVVWDVKIKGEATQPCSLNFQDSPGVNNVSYGSVVGYKDHSDRTTAYDTPIWINGNYAEANGNEKSWGHRFWVVTAYPAFAAKAGDTVQNDLTVYLYPRDNVDPSEAYEATTASWTYKDYDWTYSGDVIDADKKNNWSGSEDASNYTGWLEAYGRASTGTKKEDYGELPFKTVGYMYGYGTTHHTSEEQLGEYIQDTKYTLTTADDILYLHNGSESHMLTKDDYYFSSVVIEQTDYGYDIWEDRMNPSYSERTALINAEKLPKDFGTVNVYAMFSEPAGGKTSDEWVEIGKYLMNPSGSTTIELEDQWLNQKPYRIKVEHDSVDYKTVCEIKVKVRLKAGSQIMQQIVQSRKEGDQYTESPVIRFENLSGVIGMKYQADGESVVCDTRDSSGSGNLNYEGRVDLENKTKELYENILLVRDNAFRGVTWLNMTAKANKKYTSINDAKNNRVLVDYYLTAYDGYEIYDKSCLDDLARSEQKLISPGRNHVVFYDLLPYGMQFDASAPVTAGRITNLDGNGYYKIRPRSWDQNQVTVTVDPEKDIDPDYRGTGRTMVAFHISFSGADSTSYTSGKWIEGWGVAFRAYYDWKNMDALNNVNINANLSAFMPDFSVEDPINEDNPALYGLSNEVNCDNGEITGVSDTVKSMYVDLFKGGGNIDNSEEKFDKYTDADGKEHNYRNVLYAESILNDNVAVASESSIWTMVRADEEQYGTFRKSAVVSYGSPDSENPSDKTDRYTYELTVNTIKPITNIIVYDHLEYAAVDRNTEESKDSNKPFGPTWYGTFQGVDLSGLEKQGASATVYYSMERDAERTRDLAGSEKWDTEKDFRQKVAEEYGENAQWTDYVCSVAVAFNPNYVLPENQSISFRIQMRAPAEADQSSYAYNNASFYSCLEDQTTEGKTVDGDSVRVGLSIQGTLEVEKKTAGIIPDERADENFTFRLYDNQTKEYLPYTEYEFYKAVDGIYQRQMDRPYATDGKGYFSLKSDEKAVFHMTNIERVEVVESESVFWEPRRIEKTYRRNENGIRVPDAKGDIHVLTVTNVYRPVLYVEKKVMAVPEGVDPDQTFTFKIQVESGDSWRPLAKSEYWYVDSMLFDGGIPVRVNDDGNSWTQKDGISRTNSDGTFQIRPGQTIALFPGVAGTRYLLTEEGLDENGYSADWYCPRPSESGTIISGGGSKTITNYYRWKELNLTKRITHQNPAECTQEFTFQITEFTQTWNEEKEEWEEVEVRQPDATTGQEIAATAGKEWELIGGTEKGVLDSEGIFTCAFAGQTVRIKSLEANHYYKVKEIVPETGEFLYRPVKDTEELRIPPYSTGTNVTITNDYLKRPLSVTKIVSGEKNPENPDPEFIFTATINGTPLPLGISYVVTKEGEEDRLGVTGGENDLVFNVTDGTFKLKDGETITFQDAGMLGDSFQVTEQPVTDYTQLYPSADYWPRTISGDKAEVTFVNGSADVLQIGKEYVAEDGDSEAVAMITKWQEEIRGQSTFYQRDDTISWTDAWISDLPEDSTVELKLEVMVPEDGTYIWPVRGEDCYIDNQWKNGVWVEGVNQRTGDPVQIFWECRKGVKLPPWILLTIPTVETAEQMFTETGKILKGASFTLSETDDSQKRIMKGDSGYLKISQSSPANAQPMRGTAGHTGYAVIKNRVESIEEFNGSGIHKWMTSASSEVPTGAKLVWRLEEYKDGEWNPKEGISYAVFDDTGNAISNEVKTTDGTGEILITKTKGHYPEVRFVDAIVYLNLYKQTDIDSLVDEGQTPLRLVEVSEKSDSEWGRLAGYRTPDKAYSWTQDSYKEINAFVNSNCRTFVEVEKFTAKKSYQEFTMLLNQVVAIDGSADGINSGNYQSKILETCPGADISYTIHNVDGSKVDGPTAGTTGVNGEIRLKAGQYVTLNVPDGTVWTVSEDTYVTQNYELKNLTPDPGSGKTVKLADNLMLINLPAVSKTYKLIYNANGGTGAPIAETNTIDSTASGAVFEISQTRPVRDGYRFLGWADAYNASKVAYQPGDSITLGVSEVQKTLYALWESKDYKVTYVDDRGDYTENTWTESYDEETGGKNITILRNPGNWRRDGYCLVGWTEVRGSDEISYIEGDSAELSPGRPHLKLYAIWKETSENVFLKIIFEKVPIEKIPTNFYVDVTMKADLGEDIVYEETKTLSYADAIREIDEKGYLVLKWPIPKVIDHKAIDQNCEYTAVEHNLEIGGYTLENLKPLYSADGTADLTERTMQFEIPLRTTGKTIIFKNIYKPSEGSVPIP